MAAAPGLERDCHHAFRAFFGRGRRGRSFFLLLQAIHGPHDHEHGKGNDDKIDHGIDKDAVLDRDHRLILEIERQVAEIDAAGEQTHGRHDHVIHQRADNAAKGRADDDAHRHVHDVAAHCEFFELFQHFAPPHRK